MATVKVTDQIIVSTDALSFYNLVDGTLMARVNQLTNMTIAQEQETVWYEGKGGTRLSGIDRNKNITLTATNGMLDMGTLSLQTGSDVTLYDGATTFMEAPYIDELITVDGTTATTTYTAYSATAGAEIEYIYKLNGSSIVGATKFEQGSTASADEFEYDPATKEITLPLNAFAANETVIAQYKYKASGQSITSTTENFSKTAKVVADITTKDACTEMLSHSQMELPRGKISGAFDIAMGDSPTVHNIEISSLTSSCFGASKELLTYRVVNPVE